LSTTRCSIWQIGWVSPSLQEKTERMVEQCPVIRFSEIEAAVPTARDEARAIERVKEKSGAYRFEGNVRLSC
jgi:hypothetical protein